VAPHAPCISWLSSSRDEHDLLLHADVRITAVVAEDHAALALVRGDRPDEHVLRDLDLARPEPRLQRS